MDNSNCLCPRFCAKKLKHQYFKSKVDLFCLLTLVALLVHLVVQPEDQYEDSLTTIEDEDLIGPGPYPYIINEEEKCPKTSPNPFLVLLIATEVRSFEARRVIRQTWGNETLFPGLKLIRLFLLAKKADDPHQQAILGPESEQYHDIIQQDFLDEYNNLTLKTLMGMNWVALYCPQARYVMKTDSDMFVNIELLTREILRPDFGPRSFYYTGLVHVGMPAYREPTSKWYMPSELYPEKIYPAYCSGNAYFISGDLAKKVYNMALQTRYLPFEDVFVGICMDKLGVRPTLAPGGLKFMALQKDFSPACAYRFMATTHGHGPRMLLTYWKEIHDSKDEECKRNETRLGTPGGSTKKKGNIE